MVNLFSVPLNYKPRRVRYPDHVFIFTKEMRRERTVSIQIEQQKEKREREVK